MTYLCLADFFEVSITHLMTLSRWQLLKSRYYTLVGRTKKEKFKDKKGQGDTDTSLGRQENKEKGKEMGKEQKAKEKLKGDK